MKFMLTVLKCSFYIAFALSIVCIYALFTQDFMWIIFTIAMLLMTLCFARDYTRLQTDIEKCMDYVVRSIREYCDEAEPGRHTLNIEYNDHYFTIDIQYSYEIREETGATYMGECEVLVSKEKEYISVVKMQCLNMYDEPCSYGFTEGELQEKL